jgi:hypothetical protein
MDGAGRFTIAVLATTASFIGLIPSPSHCRHLWRSWRMWQPRRLNSAICSSRDMLGAIDELQTVAIFTWGCSRLCHASPTHSSGYSQQCKGDGGCFCACAQPVQAVRVP